MTDEAELGEPLGTPLPGALAGRGGWIVMLCALAAMAPAIDCGFAPVDDLGTFGANPRMNPPILRREGLAWFWRNPHLDIYMPLTYTVWSLVAAATYVPTPDAFGSHVDPHAFHAVNMAVHALAALAVYLLLRRLMRAVDPHAPHAPDAAALLGAVLFAVHPVQVEAVAWATLLKETLSGCLTFWAIYAYVRAAQTSRVRPYAWATLAYVAAMLAKPTAIVAPLMAVAIDVGILRRPWRTSLKWVAPWLVLAAPVAIVARLVQTAQGVPMPALWARPAVAGAAVAFYLWKLVWPATLTYEYNLRAIEMAHDPRVWAMAAVTVALGVGVWLARRRFPWLAAGALLFIAPLLPVLGLVPFSFMLYSLAADHYLYVPMLGVSMVLAWGIAPALRPDAPPARRRAVAAGASLILVLLGVRSFVQTTLWHDWVRFAIHMTATNPRSTLGWYALASHDQRTGRLDLAEQHLLRAAAANDAYPDPHQDLFQLYLRAGRADDAGRELRLFLAGAKSFPMSESWRRRHEVMSRGYEALSAGQYDEAVARFRECLAMRPGDPESQASLALAEAAMRHAATTRPVGGGAK